MMTGSASGARKRWRGGRPGPGRRHANEMQGVGQAARYGCRGRRAGTRSVMHDDSDEQQAELAPATLSDPRCDGEGLHDFTVASGL